MRSKNSPKEGRRNKKQKKKNKKKDCLRDRIRNPDAGHRMISSLLHRLNLVQTTLNDNAQLLSELQLLEFEAEPCQRDVQRGRDLDTLRNFLRRLQPRLEQSTNRLHLLTAAVIHQRAHLADLKSFSSSTLDSGAQLVYTRPLSGNTSVDASLPGEASPAAESSFVQRGRVPSRRNSPTDDLSSPSECVVVDNRCCQLANQLGNMNRMSVDGEQQYGCAGVVRVSAAEGVDCAPREGRSSAGLGVDATDVVVEVLEAEVQEQERVIHRMMRCNETLANKEQVSSAT